MLLDGGGWGRQVVARRWNLADDDLSKDALHVLLEEQLRR
jgi:hypothetical protein